MNKKGFTLIELILALVIMSLIILIIVPNVFVILNKSNEKACNSLVNNIESATKMYVTNNKYNLGFTCDGTVNITLQTLIDSGDLSTDSSGKIINPINDTEVSLTSAVSVTYNCNNNTFTYVVNGIDCTK